MEAVLYTHVIRFGQRLTDPTTNSLVIYLILNVAIDCACNSVWCDLQHFWHY